MTDDMNDVYLDLAVRKSEGKTDENGNFYFEVEASNENLDLQNQIVLQNALLESKDNFIQHGVISYDHLHKTHDAEGNVVSQPEYVIGEPVDVYTDGTSTIVKGKLYKSNPKAQDLIQKLKDGSTRIRASVGGIFPKIIRDASTGVEKIAHVLWNDLALTPTPVNNTVGYATLVKSMSSKEFCEALMEKGLVAGYGTDSGLFTSGRALMPENIGETITVTTEVVPEESEPDLTTQLINAIDNGGIDSVEEMLYFLTSRGMERNLAKITVLEILKQGGQIMSKSNFADMVDDIRKSLKEDDKADDKEEEQDETLFDDSDFEDDSDDSDDSDDEEKTEKCMKKCKKSFDEDDEYLDATAVLKSLADTIAEQNERMNELEKSLSDVGNAVVGIAQMQKSINSIPEEPKSVMTKSVQAAAVNGGVPQGRPTAEDFDKCKDILCKSFADGEINLMQQSMMESEIQKAMKLGTPMSKNTYDFIVKHM